MSTRMIAAGVVIVALFGVVSHFVNRQWPMGEVGHFAIDVATMATLGFFCYWMLDGKLSGSWFGAATWGLVAVVWFGLVHVARYFGGDIAGLIAVVSVPIALLLLAQRQVRSGEYDD